ncbi:ABSCISIC ACID-INSENSITIVE 5-like protein 5 [Lolium rigidum]|uniref:ABSCISIC ACID-INSENSITIVE 5-like protein 5 n=1 Tax=Lolium rigidum TaxID=89674 RepID=UPI001F5C82CE|nr:ABSCISIC ACID-INSENSITIVE 5-like protein 5 [Lolium rigidum]
MAMEVDEDDVWGAVATSPSVSPPPAISTALSLNTRLQLLAASGGTGPSFLPAIVGLASPFHPGGGCYRNVAASPSPTPFFSAAAATAPFSRLAPHDARRALDREMCLGPPPAAAAAGTSGAGPVERRKKRMIKNRESASRSRARKQAHVTQIETEVVELREANDQLRAKYDQLRAAVEVSVPVKKTLKRVLSAPF